MSRCLCNAQNAIALASSTFRRTTTNVGMGLTREKGLGRVIWLNVIYVYGVECDCMTSLSWGMSGKHHSIDTKNKLSVIMLEKYRRNPELKYVMTEQARKSIRKHKESSIISKEFLSKLYISDNKSLLEISSQFKISRRTLYSLLKKYNIQLKKRVKPHNYIFINRDILYKKYILEKKSAITIGKELIQPQWVIYSKLREYSIPLRSNVENRLGKKASEETKNKLRMVRKGKYIGELCSSWKGGVSSINRRLRNSSDFAFWRKKVFERDNYTCQDCGAKNGNGRFVELHPHHIKSFSKFTELRFEITNGVTLCKLCHLSKHIHKF